MGVGKGAREGCNKFVKFSLIVMNFIILIGGFVVLGVGIWTLVDKSYIEVLLRNQLYMSATYIMIIVGSFTIFISFIGCVGAHKDIKCMLLTYFILIFLMFVVLTIGGVLGYVFRDQVEHNIRPEMLHTVEVYDPKEIDSPITEAWDATQINLKCCGIAKDGMEDRPYMAWKMNQILNPTTDPDNILVPESCCLRYENGTTSKCIVEGNTNLDLIYKTDCLSVGLFFVKEHAIVIGGVAIGVSCLMVFGMIFAMVLFKVIE